MRTRRAMAAVLGLVMVISAAAVVTTLWLRHRAGERQSLIAWHHNEVEQIDRLLRRARMMPLHDTTGAEDAARESLAAVEASLLEHGPLAVGPAYYTLGFGHLMLRDLGQSEQWLQAAIDSGFSDSEAESALGIVQAMRILKARAASGGIGKEDHDRVDEALVHLSATGPRTADRDVFHRALGLYLAGRIDEAIETASESAIRFPWLYEALQLEGDILVTRASKHRQAGDLDGAVRDLRAAGEAYARGLRVARSDAWLHGAEAERILQLIALTPPDDPTKELLISQALQAAANAREARPGREIAELETRVEVLISESRGANGG